MKQLSTTPLDDAQRAIADGQGRRAAEILEDISNSDHENAAHACYVLGKLCHVGTPDTPPDLGAAEANYLRAEELGHPMASYWIARLYVARRNFRRALDRFRRVAPDNPSAAYHIYVILTDSPELSSRQGEAQEYLQLAVRQGHVFAMRREIINRLGGKQGLLRVPSGIPLLFEAIKRSWKHYESTYEGGSEITDMREHAKHPRLEV